MFDQLCHIEETEREDGFIYIVLIFYIKSLYKVCHNTGAIVSDM